jgi:uncharacterized membrane-anchored protein
VPVLFGVGLLVLSVVAGMSAEVIMFVMKNSKVIGIIALMIGIVGVGYVLYKKYEAPKPE